MNARIVSETLPGKRVEKTFTERFVFGRDPGCDLQLADSKVSGSHAEIVYDSESECFTLKDLGSKNGTRLDGVAVRLVEKLGALHVITIAVKYDFLFQIVGGQGDSVTTADEVTAIKTRPPETMREESPAVITPPSLEEPQAAPGLDAKTQMGGEPLVAPPKLDPKTQTGDEPPVAPPKLDSKTQIGGEPLVVPKGLTPAAKDTAQATPPDSPRWTLSLVSTGQTFTLKSGINSVGRMLECEVVIDDDSISRRHAEIEIGEGGATVKDLGSTNGTFVNGTKITSETPITLKDNLSFGLMDVVLQFGKEPG